MSRPTGSMIDRTVTISAVGARPRKSSLAPKPRKTITPKRRKSTGSSIPAMDRNTMMIVEANEISAYLQKEYVSIHDLCLFSYLMYEKDGTVSVII